MRIRRLKTVVASLRFPHRAVLFSVIFFGLPSYSAAQAPTVTLEAQDARSIEVSVFGPANGCKRCTLVVFSHGAFATPDRYTRLLEAWAQDGYVIVAPKHVDSEEHPQRDQYDGDAAFTARLEDFDLLVSSAVLRDALVDQGYQTNERVIAAGHSYGALIAQLAAGASPDRDMSGSSFVIERELVGAVAISPPGPIPGLIVESGWSKIAVPQLVVTGTADVLPGFIDDWRLHLASYEAATRAPAYALVYKGQNHYFGGAFGRPKASLSEDAEIAFESLLALSVAFMNSLLTDGDSEMESEVLGEQEWHGLSSSIVEARIRLP